MAGMRDERLDHLGIVAGVCQEIGLAAYLAALAGPPCAASAGAYRPGLELPLTRRVGGRSRVRGRADHLQVVPPDQLAHT
jgi:hypothetical protein